MHGGSRRALDPASCRRAVVDLLTAFGTVGPCVIAALADLLFSSRAGAGATSRPVLGDLHLNISD
jgi:hypothetical protein